MLIEIQKEINKRGITRLCHYVHTNKLLHILSSEEGIKAVNFIDKDILIQNDPLRLDGKKDYINCSIQYPNYWYFNKVKENNSLFKDWAIIFIDPVVATYEDTEFCAFNAARGKGSYVEKGYEAFLKIFEDNVEGYCRTQQMLKCAPTNDQAEVLIYHNIPRKYILGIAFENEKIANVKRSAWEVLGVPQIDVYIAPELFNRTASEKIRRGIEPTIELFLEEEQ